MATTSSSISTFRDLGVTPVINASGIYTDLGGSVLAPEVWAAATEANGVWLSIPELLDRSGERVAALCDAPAGRVVPGASAAIALATAACIAGGDGPASQALPEIVDGRANGVILQQAHRYKYARCAVLGGGHLHEIAGIDELRHALAARRPAAVLHAAHLDDAGGAVRLDEVAAMAHAHDVPVIVDAAYLSYPLELIPSFTARGADLVCFSAKYFHGPNAGGLLLGREDLIAAVREVDFTRYESGQWLNFGRGFKMDRATIVATVAALERWLALDHDERWESYRRRADALVERLREGTSLDARPAQFTLDERVVDAAPNSVVVRGDGTEFERRLLAHTPPIAAVGMADELVLCLETVAEAEDDVLLEALVAVTAT